MSVGWIVFIVLAILWIGVVLVAWKTKLLAPLRLSAYGPFLMWRTERGKALIDALSKARKAWKAYGWAAIAITFLAMGTMFALLIWIATIVPMISAEDAPSPRLILGIPGVNPVIPIWQGILGLIVAMFVHELAHGILTRAQGLRLKSLGLLFAWLPVGAFAEPDEGELSSTRKRNRMRVYAVGPATNILVAIAMALVFCTVLMGSLEPVHDAPVAMREGQFDWGEQVLSVDGVRVKTPEDIDALSFPPGTNVTVETFREGRVVERNATAGLCIVGIFEDGPADAGNISEGWLVLDANGVEVWSHDNFTAVMDGLKGGDWLNLTLLDVGDWRFHVRNVTLVDRYEYLKENHEGTEEEFDKGKGFLGVYLHYLDGPFATPEDIKSIYTNPFKYGLVSGPLTFIGLPLQQFSPIPESIQVMYEPSGITGFLPSGVFYPLADATYWIFWISIMVGLTNALPAVPLDGGYIFSDALDHVLVKLFPNYDRKKRESVIGTIVLSMALFVLALILWQFLGPRMIPFFGGLF